MLIHIPGFWGVSVRSCLSTGSETASVGQKGAYYVLQVLRTWEES
jgi:hypothetical protein